MMAARNRRTPQVVLAVAAVCLLCRSVEARYGGGSGTADDPYQIWTAEQMNAIGAEPNDWDKHFRLMADLDLSGFDGREGRPAFNIIAPDNVAVIWYPPGKPFSGVFDGNGHTISNFRCDTERRNYVGLFGYVEGPGANIRRLRLVNPTVNAGSWGGSYVGSLAGLLAGGIVMGCSVEGGTVTGFTRVGGLVGENQGHVTQCYSATTVTGEEVVGGLVGVSDWWVPPYDYWGVVSQCWSASSVNGRRCVAGLVAQNFCAVVRCYSVGRVSCTSGERAGGLIGENRRLKVVQDCFWDTEASGQTIGAAGMGLTTARMRDMRTYLDARWDWVGETENGTCELWQIPKEGGYPRLTIFGDYAPVPLRGLGTPEDPYRVSNAAELGAAVHYSPYAHYRLDASIDLAGIRWRTAPIPWFAGTFDGNGMTILHTQIEGVDFPALFGQLAPGAEVKDLGVVDVNITASDVALVGGLAGGNAGTLTRCYSSGRVAGDYLIVGGLVGENLGALAQCYSTCVVDGNQAVGGLVGHSQGSLTRCYSTGAVNGRSGVGGLVGSNEGRVAECYSRSSCAGEGGVGGLAASNSGELTDCYSTGAVRSSYNGGGLLGGNDGGVLRCYSTGPISGRDMTGGLVAYNASAVTACFWDTQTSGFVVSAGGQGRTTAELQRAATFLGWGACDEEGVWVIDEGKDYPRLRWEGASGRALPTTMLADLLQGDGTAENPFQIHTAAELNTIGLFPCEWSKHYRLMADIDLSACTGTQFNMLGTDLHHAFTGVFDGNGHAISGFTCETQAWAYLAGLFGCVDAPAEIRDVRLVAPTVHARWGNDVGALASSLRGGTIIRCRVEGGTVTGSGTTGGLVGSNWDGTIAYCRVTATIDGGNQTGGVVGWNRADVTGCLADGRVWGGDCTGGVVGRNEGLIRACCATALVAGVDFVGGLTGLHEDGTMANCYSTAPVNGWRRVGGLTGLNAGRISACYSAGTVVGDITVGGLIGDVREGSVSDAFWDIEASGQAGSAGGAGKTTAQMRTAATFLDPGWDFAGETANGTQDIWWIREGQDYPRLWWEPE